MQEKGKALLKEITDSTSFPSWRLGSNGNFTASVPWCHFQGNHRHFSPLHGPDSHQPQLKQTPESSFAPLPSWWAWDVLAGNKSCRHTCCPFAACTQLPFCSDRLFPLSCGNLTCPPITITRRIWKGPSWLQHKKMLSAFRERTSSVFFLL